MILNFKKVILHNFASYEHAEVDLESKGFCFVSGRNLYKKDNSYSNGSGKSFIWNALCFALTGETIAGQHSGLKNLMNDEDNSYTSVEVKVNTDQYIITRVIAPKSDLQIIKNGKDISGKGIRESEKKLAEVLPDLNKDFIASTFIIGQGMPNAFSKFSPSGRKELLEKLTKSDYMIEEIKQRVSNRLINLNTNLRECDDSLLVLNTKVAETTKYQASAKAKLDAMVKPEFDRQISELQLRITEAETELVTITSQLQAAVSQANALESQYSEQLTNKDSEIDKLNETYNTSVRGGYDKKNTLAVKSAQIAAEIKTIKTEITRIESIKEYCPTCGQKLLNVNKPSTNQLKEDLSVKIDSEKSITENIMSIDLKLAEISQKRQDELRKINTNFENILSKLRADKQKLQLDLTRLQTHQLQLKSAIGLSQADIKRLESDKSTWDDNYNNLKRELSQYETNIQTLNEKIRVLTEEKLDLNNHIATVKKIDTLVRRDLRGYLLANTINYINKRAKDFSEIVFGTRDLELALSGNVLDISYCNRMFDNLSGGEKMRVDLILQLAIRDMLKMYLNTHANILILDEITDFLDRQSCAAVVKLIETELNTVESVFVISHHVDELGLMIDTELKVVKDENGISSLAY